MTKWQPVDVAPPDNTVVFVRLAGRRYEYAAFHHPTKGWFINQLKHKDSGRRVAEWRLMPELPA